MTDQTQHEMQYSPPIVANLGGTELQHFYDIRTERPNGDLRAAAAEASRRADAGLTPSADAINDVRRTSRTVGFK